MKYFPKTISTGQDIEHCFDMVKAGELEAEELHCALTCIEERAYLQCPIVSLSGDRRKATIRYCCEAAAGMAGNAVIVGVQHVADPDAPGMDGNAPGLTVLSLEAPLMSGETVIKIPAADPFAEMGITRARAQEIKEALTHEHK